MANDKPTKAKRSRRMTPAERERLRALREKHGLGEYKKSGGASKREKKETPRYFRLNVPGGGAYLVQTVATAAGAVPTAQRLDIPRGTDPYSLPKAP